MSSSRPRRLSINGWLVFDKPVGMTSTYAVALVKRVLNATKAGHAGTLDPLASGLLPIALGEATKTVPFVQEGVKNYRFTVQWGGETDTDDSDGKIVHRSDKRPVREDMLALLPQFIGTIMQVPPVYSALKIKGERAYDIARDGEEVILPARPVVIHALTLLEATPEQATFETSCGKGTYVRAIARDLGRLLGCYGHIVALRRLRVGPFLEQHAVTPAQLETSDPSPLSLLQPLQSSLVDLPCVQVDPPTAARLRRGQSILLRGDQAPASGIVYAMCQGAPVVFGAVEKGELVPSRVFNI